MIAHSENIRIRLVNTTYVFMLSNERGTSTTSQGGVLKVFIKNTSDDDVRREAAILLLLEFHKVSGVPKLLEWTTTLEGDEGGRKQAILIEDGGRCRVCSCV